MTRRTRRPQAPPTSELLRLDSRDSARVVRAFALYGLAFRLVGAAVAQAYGLSWLALVQLLGGGIYSLFAVRSRSVPTVFFLGVLGPEWAAWGFAVGLGVGMQAFFHLHAVLVTASTMLLFHDVPPRERVFFFLLPIVAPAPFLPILNATVPHIELSTATSSAWLIANQLIGAGVLVVSSGLAMLDHARARQLAEERAGAQTRLVEDLSHEARTPIATILMAAQAARATGEASASIDESLEWIEESARGGGRLVERMLDLATLDRGRRPEPEPAPLGAATRAAVERLRPLAAARSVGLGYRVDAELEPEPEVDAVSLDVVLRNLVTNAIDHSPEGGTVDVRRTTRDGAIRIDVEDRGVGIAAEDLPRVFDRMWRADRARARDEGRFGLGLSIARRHAELIGATLEVRSRVGIGSVFSVVFVRDLNASPDHRLDDATSERTGAAQS